ncbi:MAG: hypothetical protein LBJ78_03845 [Puniceicoccales bacterium]|jgi:hypothetical protein|nr:hypothetical protein [Puniceicoccales bacterium]
MKKVYVFGVAIVALFSARLQAEFVLGKAKVDNDGKEVLFVLNAGNGKDLYYVESFVDDTDPQNPQVVRGFKKVEKNFSEAYEAYLKKKSAKGTTSDK